MTKNLGTANALVKLILPIAVLIFYFTDQITGRFAMLLMALAIIDLLILLVKVAFTLIIRD